MPTSESGDDAEDVIRNCLAMKIVDEPSSPGCPLGPLKEANDILVGEMMGEQ